MDSWASTDTLDQAAVEYLSSPTAHFAPWSFFDTIRSAAPVYRTSIGPVLISDYEGVGNLLTDERWSVERAYNSMIDTLFDRPEVAHIFLSGIGKRDNPTHLRLRRMLTKWFTPRSIRAWSSLIDEIVLELLDRFDGKDEVDLMNDFALPIPQRLMSAILGVPYEDRDQLQEWGLAVINRPIDGGSDQSRRTLTVAMEELCEYLRKLILDRSKNPGDDLLSDLIQTREGSDKLSEHELIAICAELISGGHETTSNLIANGSVLLMRNPRERERMMADQDLVAGAVEESLRMEPPTMYSHPRYATEAMEMSGVEINTGDIAYGMLGSANRDPKRFPEPDRFIIDRPANQHQSFAAGMHFCLGAPLARYEAIEAFRALFERYPNVQTVSDEIEWKQHMRMHGPSRLPVRLS